MQKFSLKITCTDKLFRLILVCWQERYVQGYQKVRLNVYGRCEWHTSTVQNSVLKLQQLHWKSSLSTYLAQLYFYFIIEFKWACKVQREGRVVRTSNADKANWLWAESLPVSLCYTDYTRPYIQLHFCDPFHMQLVVMEKADF